MRTTMTLLLILAASGCDRRDVEPPLAPQVAPPSAPVAKAEPVAPSQAHPEGHPAAATGMPAGHGGMAAAASRPEVAVGEFSPADRTIADTRAHRQELAGKTLEVRGVVTKANHGILGRNWLHLKDRSGEQDLVVTTTDAAQAGDLVRAKGIVAVDRDVGAGYQFDLLIEDAAVVVEVGVAPAPVVEK